MPEIFHEKADLTPPQKGRWRPSNEFQLVAALAKFPFNEAAKENVRRLLATSYDPKIVLQLIRFHRLAVHIAQNLNRLDNHGLEKSFRYKIAFMGVLAEKRGRRQVEKLLDIKAVFDDQNIPIMPIKGPATAQVLYGNPVRRVLYDIDILVQAGQTLEAVKSLKGMGFQHARSVLETCMKPSLIHRLQAWGSNIGFTHPEDEGLLIELHWRPGRYKTEFPVSEEELWSKACSRSIDGQIFSVMDPIHEILFLASHGCKHEFKRLHWLLDIATVAEDDKFNWSQTVILARELGLTNHLGLALCLANQVFGAKTPDPARPLVDRKFIKSRASSILCQRYSNFPENDTPWQEAKMEWRNAGLAGGFSHRIRILRAHLSPGPDDWVWVKWPEFLSFMYYPTRLARILTTLIISKKS